jgi:hypothetical protein
MIQDLTPLSLRYWCRLQLHFSFSFRHYLGELLKYPRYTWADNFVLSANNEVVLDCVVGLNNDFKKIL